MTVRESLREGARRLNAAIRCVFIFYAATTVAALLAAGGAMIVAWQSLGHSAWAPRMLANFDLEWVAELTAQYGRLAVAPLVLAAAGVLAVFAVAWLFLTGGALEVLCAGGPSFAAGCGKHFWRLARLAVWAGICALVPLAAGGILARIGNWLWGEGLAATPLFFWGWFRGIVVLCGLAAVNLAFDYAAISMAVEDIRDSLAALARAFRLMFRHPGRILGLYGALWLILALVVALAFGISRMASQTSLAAVVALFLFRQAAVLAKTWCWLLFFPAQSAMWQTLQPSPAIAEPTTAVIAEAPPAPSAGETAQPDEPGPEIPAEPQE